MSLVKCVCVAFVAVAGRRYTYTVCTSRVRRALLACAARESPERMLWADKRALETNLKLSLLQIRERELNFYTNNCLAISTQSALLAGFAYAALMPGISLGDAGGVAAHVYVVKLMYLACAVSALGLQLITVVSTTLLSMLGPGLALRGPDGSMHTARAT